MLTKEKYARYVCDVCSKDSSGIGALCHVFVDKYDEPPTFCVHGYEKSNSTTEAEWEREA